MSLQNLGLKTMDMTSHKYRGQEPSSALAGRFWFTQGFSLAVATACLGWELSQVAPHRLAGWCWLWAGASELQHILPTWQF